MTDTAATVRVLERLVGFDTTSSRSNLDLIRFVDDHLRACGIGTVTVGSVDGSKAGLIASIGPDAPGGIVLSGHTDVVPVAGQAWASDPFRLSARGARLYGRGTADMKGFIAGVLAAVPAWSRRALRRPIHIVLSYDEEVGCLAQPMLVTRLLERVPRPAMAIVGEPSDMRVANRHRGIRVFTTDVTGRAGHSGRPGLGVSAIVAAARCIQRLDAIAGEERESGDAATTLNVGIIEGGQAVNIIADRARFIWECRPADERDAGRVRHAFDGFVEGAVLPGMRRTAPEAAVTTTETVAVPALSPHAGSPAEELTLALTGGSACGDVPFTSEAGFFQQAGIPTVICGPGSAEQAHQADEFVHRDQLDAFGTFLDRLAERLSDG